MDNGYSLADIATATGDGGFGGNSWIVLIILFAMIFGWGGNGIGRNDATSQEILFGQQFQNLDNKMDRLGNGIADSTFALNNAINGVQASIGGQIADLKYDNAMQNNATQAMIHAEGEKTRELIQQNKIETLQSRISQLELQQAMCGVPKVNTNLYGIYPYATSGCGCNCNNI